MTNKDLTAAYVFGNIRHRQCSKYIADPKYNLSRCKCGRGFEWHIYEGIVVDQTTGDQVWSVDEHTREIDPDSFGEIKFYGFGNEVASTSPYIRVDHKTEVSSVWTLMDEYWGLNPPKLLISVTGGAKSFQLKQKLLSLFKRGLVNAARSTGAWIVTGGMHQGVMKYVGEAIQEHSLMTGGTDIVTCIGICTWGAVDNKAALIGEKGQGLFPASYNIDDLQNERHTCRLDHNHTHFILVDDGTEKQYGREIEFRAAFERAISEVETSISEKQSVNVPVVQLLLEGGANSVETVFAALKQDIPVVIIAGSGRAADLFAYAYKITRNRLDPEDCIEPDNFVLELAERLKVLFDIHVMNEQTEERMNSAVTAIRTSMKQYRKLLTVYEINEENQDLDKAILNALLRANKSNIQSQLNFALAWNRVDIARSEIFSAENRPHWKGSLDCMNDAMSAAIVQNNVEFVQLFLDVGIELKRFLTVQRLKDLYSQVLKDRYADTCRDLLRELIQEQSTTWKQWMCFCCVKNEWHVDNSTLLTDVGRVIRALLGDQYPNFYASEKFCVSKSVNFDESTIDPKATRNWKQDLTDSKTPPQHISLTARSDSRHKTLCSFASPEKELFIWAVLLNRMELAKLFWRMGQDHIGTTLIAATILKRLSDKAADAEEIDLSLQLEKNSKECETLSIGVLNECYVTNKDLGRMCLIRTLDEWGSATLLGVADNGEHMDFLGHTSCQICLNKIWRGNMALYTATWKIVLSSLLPFFMIWIKFSSRVSPYKNLMGALSGTSATTTNRTLYDAVKKPSKLYSVSWVPKSKQGISLPSAVFYFYTAPVTKFIYNVMSQLIFLMIYSFVVLTQLRPVVDNEKPSSIEICVWVWIMTLIVEEIRQVYSKDPRSLRFKIMGWFDNVWNRFDLCVYLLFIIAIVLRYTMKTEEDFRFARMVYALDLSMFFLRFMQVFFVDKNIGPKVIMIRKMLTDLMFFFAILVVFLLSYGVAIHALLYPNSKADWGLLKDVVYKPYWQMYGELFLDEMEGKNTETCSRNPMIYNNETSGYSRCSQSNWLAPALFAVYMILTNVLLLNLLIAMFSYTFQTVQDNSEKVWRFYRYSLIFEYFDRPTLAAPLIIISHVTRFVKMIINTCQKTPKTNNAFKFLANKEDTEKIRAFEKVGMESYLYKVSLKNAEQIDRKVQNAGERIEQVINELEQIKETVTSQGPVSGQPAAIESEYAIPLNAIKVQESARSKDEQAIEIRNLNDQMKTMQDRMHNQSAQIERMVTMLENMSYSRPRRHNNPQIDIEDIENSQI
ncbi:transient receptor potential cation channel subfamily M member-like 2 isoform X2 [Tubulanus polymorphus]|uniref:transient receptor potential cation channel subfamily M member-like 2 isoform X2 n=1 Tax=Tubulanus polymorphus TaxID=672921 RepID=UPI003DA476D8